MGTTNKLKRQYNTPGDGDHDSNMTFEGEEPERRVRGRKRESQKMSNFEAHIYKMSEPRSLTNIMVNAPICLLLIAFFIMALITSFVANLGWILPGDTSGRDFLVWGADVVN